MRRGMMCVGALAMSAPVTADDITEYFDRAAFEAAGVELTSCHAPAPGRSAASPRLRASG